MQLLTFNGIAETSIYAHRTKVAGATTNKFSFQSVNQTYGGVYQAEYRDSDNELLGFSNEQQIFAKCELASTLKLMYLFSYK